MSKLESIEKLRVINKILSDQIESLSNFEDEQLAKSQGSEWSALQVLEHLMKTEALSLKYVNYKIDQGTVFKQAGFKQKYNSWIMKRVYKSKRKFSAPDGVQPEGNYLKLSEVKTDYMAFRKTLYDFINAREEKEFGLVMYKHPIFGRLTLLQMLVFFEGHAIRHGKQIDRILTSYAAT